MKADRKKSESRRENCRIDIETLKTAAAGRWQDILSSEGGVAPSILDGKHHPCPRCGGKDRFRLIDSNAGAVLCNQCFSNGNGDGIAAIQWLCGCDFHEAVNRIADHLGITSDGRHTSNGQRDIVVEVAQRKRIPIESFKAFGAKPAKRGKLAVCRIPMYGPDGQHCSNFDMATVDEKWLKGLSAKGKPTGLFLKNGNLPNPCQTVLITEGVKDAAALSDQGHIAVGLPTKELNVKFTKLFIGCQVIIVPDRDVGGEAGAKKTAARLKSIAQSVRIATLPSELKQSNGDGVREILMKRDGEQLLSDAIATAQEWNPAPDTGGDEPKKNPQKLCGPYQPFPMDILPEPIGIFIRNSAETIGCDPAMVALPTLSSLAAAIGNTRRIQLKRGWSEPATIWTAIIARSGKQKSPALDRGVEILQEIQKREFREHASKMEKYQKDFLDYLADLAEWKKTGRKNDEPQPEEPVEPQPWRIIVSDATVEALAPLLQFQPRGLFMFRDELSGWIGGFDQYKGGKGSDIAHWLEMNRAGMLVVDRKTGNQKTIVVPRASVCVAGGIQPEVLHRVLGREHVEDGFCARILLSMPPERTKRWTEKETDPHIEAQMKGLFGRLLELEFNTDESGELLPVVIPLSSDGKGAWIEFYNRHAAEQSKLVNSDLNSAWSKLEAYAARFALIFHCVRNATGESLNAVDSRSITAAVGLVQWFCHEARRIYAQFEETEEERESRKIIEIIDQVGGLITENQLRVKCSFLATNEDAETVLNNLVQAEAGCWENVPTGQQGGRPTRAFRLKYSQSQNHNPTISEEKESFSYSRAPESFETATHQEAVVEEFAYESGDYGEI